MNTSQPPLDRMSRPKLLDLFSGAGGCGYGYHLAGFDVVGIDIRPQPRYPFEFHQADALGAWLNPIYLRQFDAIHASPPCQAFTNAQKIRGNQHPDLLEPIRRVLQNSGLPYVIENVPGAPLYDPIELCGAMFGLRTYRHRLFECNFPAYAPTHPKHLSPLRKMGRQPRDGEFMHVVGNFSNVKAGREAMGIPWMTRDELREAIPPAYTEWIGKQLLAHIEEQAA